MKAPSKRAYQGPQLGENTRAGLDEGASSYCCPNCSRSHGVPKRIRGAGFTLLEVMVALAILGVSFAALVGTQSSAVVLNRYIRDISVATLLARSKMIRIEHEVRKEGMKDFDTDMNGDFSRDGYPQYKWHAHLEKLELGDGAIEGLQNQVPQDRESAVQQLSALPALEGMNLSDLPINPTMAIQGVQYLPMLVEMLGDHVRKMTLTLTWLDGRKNRSLEISTYLVLLEPGGTAGTTPDGPGMPGMPGTPGVPGAPGTPSTPPVPAGRQGMPPGAAPRMPGMRR